MRIFSDALYEEMIAAAVAAGSTRVEARLSYVRQQVNHPLFPAGMMQADTKVTILRCSPPPCIELWAVRDRDIEEDWVVA